MARGILQASIQNRGLVLDPRTKLVMLFDIALFVLGSAGGGVWNLSSPSSVPCPLC